MTCGFHCLFGLKLLNIRVSRDRARLNRPAGILFQIINLYFFLRYLNGLSRLSHLSHFLTQLFKVDSESDSLAKGSEDFLDVAHIVLHLLVFEDTLFGVEVSEDEHENTG